MRRLHLIRFCTAHRQRRCPEHKSGQATGQDEARDLSGDLMGRLSVAITRSRLASGLVDASKHRDRWKDAFGIGLDALGTLSRTGTDSV